MGKILSLVLGLSVVAFVAWYAITSYKGPSGEQTPHQTLNNVREAAKRIETEDQKRVDDAVKKGQEAERE